VDDAAYDHTWVLIVNGTAPGANETLTPLAGQPLMAYGSPAFTAIFHEVATATAGARRIALLII